MSDRAVEFQSRCCGHPCMDSYYVILYHKVIKAVCHLSFLNLICKWKLLVQLTVDGESTSGSLPLGPLTAVIEAAFLVPMAGGAFQSPQ